MSPLAGQSTSAVRNSAHFVWFISSESLERDEVLISFDVVSLFTRIPTVDVAHRRLEDDDTLPDRTNLTVQSIVLLLDFCLKAAYLMYRDCFYQQTFGTAMESLVSVTVANVVMEEIEQTALSPFVSPPRF